MLNTSSHTNNIQILRNTFDEGSLMSLIIFISSTDTEVNITKVMNPAVGFNRSAAGALPLQRKDPLMHQDQPVLKVLAGPRLINRPSLLKNLHHLCSSSLLVSRPLKPHTCPQKYLVWEHQNSGPTSLIYWWFNSSEVNRSIISVVCFHFQSFNE